MLRRQSRDTNRNMIGVLPIRNVYYKITSVLRVLWLVNTRVWIRVSKYGNFHHSWPVLSRFSFAGRYLFIETTSVLRGAKATFTSPQYDGSVSGRCVTFWYHMNGSDMGTLNVRVNEVGGKWKAGWSKSGNQGNRWFFAQLSPKVDTKFIVS